MSKFNKPWYFISICGESNDDTYDGDTDLIDYTVVFTPLTDASSNPCTLLEWFKGLWKGTSDDCEAYISKTLKVPTIHFVHMLWTVFDLELIESYPSHIQTEEELITWLTEKMCSERFTKVTPNGMFIGSTGEFDIEYAFFTQEAISSDQLGKHLSTLIQINPKTQAVEATKSIYRASAYLENEE